MRIGTIGAREVALAVAREALARGHKIVLSSRSGPGALAGKVTELGRGASAATVEEAASLDYVLLAVQWRNVEAALRGLPKLNGVSSSTPPTRSPRPAPISFLPTSAASAPARLWPVSRQEHGSSRHSTPSVWPVLTRGRSRAKAGA